MKSSIHVMPVKTTSEKHNNREQDLSYVRKDLIHENSSFFVATISATRDKINAAYQESRGQKIPKTATPIREAVLLIDKHHTAKDLKELGDKLQERFGIKTIQAYAHKDEGHYDKLSGEWKPNYHAHMVFDWTDEKGKSFKLDKEDMAEMQTIVSEHLGLERGQKSTKKHIESTTYKAIKVEEDLAKVHQVEKVLPRALVVIKQAKGLQDEIKTLEGSKNDLKNEINENTSILDTLKKELKDKELEVERVKELEKVKNEIEQKTELARANLNYLEKKTEVARVELQKVEEQKQVQEAKKSQGLKL